MEEQHSHAHPRLVRPYGRLHHLRERDGGARQTGAHPRWLPAQGARVLPPSHQALVRKIRLPDLPGGLRGATAQRLGIGKREVIRVCHPRISDLVLSVVLRPPCGLTLIRPI